MVTELQPLIDLESWLQSSACGLPSEQEVQRFRLKGKQPVSALAPGPRVSKTSTAKNSGTKVLKQHTKSEVKRKSCKSGPLCDWRLRPRRPELWLHHTYPAEFPKCLLMDATDEMGISLLSSLARFGDAAPNGDQIVITYATICSGSDIINAALSNLAKAIYEKFKVRVTFEHLWACEFSEPKRKWIAENYNVDMIFTDVCKLMDEAGCQEHRSGQLKKPTRPCVMIAGTSCRDASRMSSLQMSSRGCVAAASGTTGSTFCGLRTAAESLKPTFVFLENVPGLQDKIKCKAGQPPPRFDSNFAAVRHSFRTLGYNFTFKTFNSSECAVKQRRERLYMCVPALQYLMRMRLTTHLLMRISITGPGFG